MRIVDLVVETFDLMVDPEVLARHRAARERVVRWQAAEVGSRLHHREPFDRELNGKGVRLLAAAPDPPKPYEEYGYDADGVLCFVREPIVDYDSGDLEWFDERSFLELPDGWLIPCVRPGHDPGEAFSISRLVVEDERVVCRIDHAAREYTQALVQEYRWAEERPVSVLQTRVAPDLETDEWSARDGTLVEATYDDDTLEELSFEQGDGRTIAWSRGKAGDTHAMALRRWKRALLRAVPALVGRASAGQQLHAVGLLHPTEDPFELTVVAYRAPQAEIALAIGEPGSLEAYLAFWNPAEALSLGLAEGIPADQDPELSHCAAALRSTREDPPTVEELEAEAAVLVAVARKLNGLDDEWRVDQPLPETFVVWPVDLELEDLEAGLDAAIPARRRSKLHELGRAHTEPGNAEG